MCLKACQPAIHDIEVQPIFSFVLLGRSSDCSGQNKLDTVKIKFKRKVNLILCSCPNVNTLQHGKWGRSLSKIIKNGNTVYYVISCLESSISMNTLVVYSSLLIFHVNVFLVSLYIASDIPTNCIQATD